MNETKKWIWQHEDFLHFTYDYSQIEPLVYTLIEKSGELKGRMSYLSSYERTPFLSKPLLMRLFLLLRLKG